MTSGAMYWGVPQMVCMLDSAIFLAKPYDNRVSSRVKGRAPG